MAVIQNVLIVVYGIVCLVLVILIMAQAKKDAGASEAIMGGNNGNSFYEKNKGRTPEGRLVRSTVVTGIIFLILTIVLSVVYTLK